MGEGRREEGRVERRLRGARGDDGEGGGERQGERGEGRRN